MKPERRMTGMTRSSAGLDARRRKALYRAWHRGMREADLVLGGFADREIAAMSESDLARFESLLDCPDREVIAWIMGEVPVPGHHDTAMFRRIRDGVSDGAGGANP
jgi:antitoxin CptB